MIRIIFLCHLGKTYFILAFSLQSLSTTMLKSDKKFLTFNNNDKSENETYHASKLNHILTHMKCIPDNIFF